MRYLLKLLLTTPLILCTFGAFSFDSNTYFVDNSDSIITKIISDSIYTFPEILIKNEEEAILKLGSAFKDSLQIIYFIPEVYCAPMVQRETSYINQTAMQIGLDKFIVLTSFRSHRDYISFKRSNCARLSCYNIEPDNYEVIAPMILVLNKDLILKKGGFTKKQEPQKTIEFLQKISEYLFGINNIKIE